MKNIIYKLYTYAYNHFYKYGGPKNPLLLKLVAIQMTIVIAVSLLAAIAGVLAAIAALIHLALIDAKLI